MAVAIKSSRGRARSCCTVPAGRRARNGRAGQPATVPGERALLLAIALSGFAAMVDEVAWARLFIGLVFSSSVYAFGVMLLLFLTGIGMGGAIYARLRAADPARVLGLALVGNTFAALLGIALVPQLPFAYMRGFPGRKDSFAFREALQLVVTATLVLPRRSSSGCLPRRRSPRRAVLARRGPRRRARDGVEHGRHGVAGEFLGGFVLVP